jgi:hypothetical protein
MTANSEELELKDRLNLIENMIAEGRRTTESWGWVFVLWGVAYFIATAWDFWGRSTLAWPVTMTAACVLTIVTISFKAHHHGPRTTIGRAIGSVWVAMGTSMFVLFFSLGSTGRFEYHTFVAIVGAMLGTANATSSMILKWKVQFACAVVWWATTVAACLGTATQTTIAFLAATFFCQIVFGIYGMIREARVRRQGEAHA